MIRWIPYTFVRTVLFFIGGILTGFHLRDLLDDKILLFSGVALACVYLVLVCLFPRVRRGLNPGWIGLPLIFCLGAFNVVSHTESRRPTHLVNNADNIRWYRAVISGFPEERARTFRAEARVTDVRGARWKEAEGKVMLYFSKDHFVQPFRYGDVLVIKGSPRPVEGPANPGEFDYKAHMALKNIYHQHFLRADDVKKTGYAPPSRVMGLAGDVRTWAEGTLHRYITGQRERAIASALVLGVTDGLDNELLDAYSATGSMHILAVSGLHISIIYFIVLWILSPLNKMRGGRWWVAFLSLAILWLYGFVTGLSPSVLRAVTMFSFLALARPWMRTTNVFNTLGVSAFLLLCVDPFLLFSVGFQLSYIAVLGIVYLYPRILLLWEPAHTFLVEIWKLCAIAIAAQIATFPLGLLYFHQFPNYFLVSNLLVVPLSFVVLVLGLLLLAGSFSAIVATAVGFCIELVTQLLNSLVFKLEALPFSRIENVYITPWQCALLFLFLIFACALFEYKRFVYIKWAFITVTIFAVLQWVHFTADVNVQKIAVYKVPGYTAIELIDRGHSVFVADSLGSGDQKIRYHILPHRLIAGVEHVDNRPPVAHAFSGGRILIWRGKRVLQMIDRAMDIPDGMRVDLIIVSNNAAPDVGHIVRRVACDALVLDSSNSFFFASRFLEAAKLYKLDVHSVLHHGAFIQNLETEDS